MLCLTKNKSKKISVSEARKETLELTMCKQCLFVVNYLLYFLSLSIHTLSTEWFAGGTHKKYDKETCKLKYICKDIWSSGLVLTVTSSKWILTVPGSAKKEIDWSILWNTRTYELSIASGSKSFFAAHGDGDSDVNESGKKRHRFILAKQQLCTCFTHV